MHQQQIVVIILISLFLITFPTFAQADFQVGQDAYDKGDYETAFKEWRPLAEQGDVAAQSRLAFMYHQGQGMPQDRAQTIQWYQKASGNGNVTAQHRLPYMPQLGQRVSQDYSEAVRWYRGAAKQGEALAQVALGINYVLGKGVPIDYVQAHFWFTQAAAQGNPDGGKFKDDLEEEMSDEQLAKAKQLAQEWKSRLPKKTD